MIPPTTPRLQVTRLDWDSEFFGFAVGCVTGVPATKAVLDEILTTAFLNGFQLIYWFTNGEDTRCGPLTMSNIGKLVDLKCIYEKSIRCSEESQAPPEASGSCSIVDMAALQELALQSGYLSRFKIDSKIPHSKWVELYSQWISRSVAGTISDAVLVERVAGRVSGMITLAKNKEGSTGSIGLFAVDERARGNGMGKRLLQRAEGWCLAEGCDKMSVSTQGNNEGAKAIYEGMGFKCVSASSVYHFWRP
jgi:dTDP-4-amino-4,6-dideoxy-D-galactose acyltransferase